MSNSLMATGRRSRAAAVMRSVRASRARATERSDAVRADARERVGRVSRDRLRQLGPAREDEDAPGDLLLDHGELVGFELADELVDGAREHAVDRGVEEGARLLLERLAVQELLDAARQRLVHHLVHLVVYAFARDEDFFEEAEL